MIAPAKTGRDSKSKKTVTKIDQTKRGNRSNSRPGARMLNIVVMKLMAPKIEEMPAKWRLKIAMSTDPPECA